jgi:hypothetical protein
MNFEEQNPLNSTPKSSTTKNEIFTLYVWPGEWDLDSMDAECLTALARF